MASTLLLRALIAAVIVCGVLCLDLSDDSSLGNSTLPNNTTTTDSPTTTGDAKTTQTSTVAPTTPQASTTVKPKGTPVYELKGDDGKNCMVLHASIDISVTTINNQTVTSPVPYSDPVKGVCGNKSTVMVLEFTAALDNETNVDMVLSLTVTLSSNAYQLSQVRVDVSGGDNETFVANVTDFKTSKGSSYKCADKQTVSATNLNVEFSDLQLAAFSADIKKDFKDLTVNDCKSAPNKTDAIVPIAVGCALAVMVLIVLIGYCIGRRRVRPGYQQMAE